METCMRKFLKLWIVLATIIGTAAGAFGGSMTMMGAGKPATGAVVPLSIDGSAVQVSNSTGTLTAAISTSNVNDIIIAHIESNGGLVSSVTGGGLTWNFRSRSTGGNQIEIWYATSTGTLSSASITATLPTVNFGTMTIFAVTGGKLSAPFDGSSVVSTTVPGDPLSITTTAADTMVIGGFRHGGATTAGSGFTSLASANFALSEYKILSSAQTLSVAVTSAGSTNGGVVDALVQGP